MSHLWSLSRSGPRGSTVRLSLHVSIPTSEVLFPAIQELLPPLPAPCIVRRDEQIGNGGVTISNSQKHLAVLLRAPFGYLQLTLLRSRATLNFYSRAVQLLSHQRAISHGPLISTGYTGDPRSAVPAAQLVGWEQEVEASCCNQKNGFIDEHTG